MNSAQNKIPYRQTNINAGRIDWNKFRDTLVSFKFKTMAYIKTAIKTPIRLIQFVLIIFIIILVHQIAGRAAYDRVNVFQGIVHGLTVCYTVKL
jgi:hypothetical protein